jgi:hypothetical protein
MTRARQRWGLAVVDPAGGGADLDGVRPVVEDLDGPADGLLGVVAVLAQALAVAGARLAVVGDRLGMVDVPDGGVTPRRTTHLVAQPDEPGEAALEASTPGVHSDQLTVVRTAVEVAQLRQPGRAGTLRELVRRLPIIQVWAPHDRNSCAAHEENLAL